MVLPVVCAGHGVERARREGRLTNGGDLRRSVAVVLQFCWNGVTVMLQWCYSGVTVVLKCWRVTVMLSEQ
jgi:hypothetical protein